MDKDVTIIEVIIRIALKEIVDFYDKKKGLEKIKKVNISSNLINRSAFNVE